MCTKNKSQKILEQAKVLMAQDTKMSYEQQEALFAQIIGLLQQALTKGEISDSLIVIETIKKSRDWYPDIKRDRINEKLKQVYSEIEIEFPTDLWVKAMIN